MARVLGPHSVVDLTGERHRQERRLLTRPIHGRSLRAHRERMHVRRLPHFRGGWRPVAA